MESVDTGPESRSRRPDVDEVTSAASDSDSAADDTDGSGVGTGATDPADDQSNDLFEPL